MADEINYNATVRVTSGELNHRISEGNVTLDMETPERMHVTVQALTTTAENMTTGDVSLTNGGWLWLKNMDATEDVQFGIDASGFVATGLVPAGKLCGPIPLITGVTYQLKAVANTPDVRIDLFGGG